MEFGVEVEEPRGPSLSPSRAMDFKTCPLLYRFRMIDKLPEEPSPLALRGTVVHKALENLFDLPAAERTPARAATLVRPAWEEIVRLEEEVAVAFTADELDPWLDSCAEVLARYFDLEDPRLLEPAERELYVNVEIDGGLTLRGVIDRLDIAPDGSARVVDYKTGKAARPGREAAALFQLRVYGLILYRARGIVPAVLQLIYLGNTETVSYRPDLNDLLATERVLLALRAAIATAETTGDWQPSPSFVCGWCSFKAFCPAWGGTPPPLPERATTPKTATPKPATQEDTTARQT